MIFSTLQKFSPMAGEEDFPMLSDRRNIIVIADEAHRSQYGFDAKLDQLHWHAANMATRIICGRPCRTHPFAGFHRERQLRLPM